MLFNVYCYPLGDDKIFFESFYSYIEAERFIMRLWQGVVERGRRVVNDSVKDKNLEYEFSFITIEEAFFGDVKAFTWFDLPEGIIKPQRWWTKSSENVLEN